MRSPASTQTGEMASASGEYDEAPTRSWDRNAQPSTVAISNAGSAFRGGSSAAIQPNASARGSSDGATGAIPASGPASAASSEVSEAGRRWGVIMPRLLLNK